MTASSAGRIDVPSLTGLRILAAGWVLLFHWHFTPGTEYQGLKDALEPLIGSGYLGVDLFYVVSGFVITLTYLDRMGRRPRIGQWGRFWWARICRVWPAYAVVTVAFGAWLMWRRSVEPAGYAVAYQNIQPDYGWWSWVKQLLLVQLWGSPIFDGTSFIGAAWSVSAEMAAYAVFPLLVLVLFRVRRLPWPVLLVGSVALLVPAALRDVNEGVIYFPFSWLERIMTCFGSGALMFLAVRQLWDSPRARRWAPPIARLLVVEIALLMVWGCSGWWGQPVAWDRYGPIAVLFPLLIGALALSDTGPAAFLSRGPMILGGKISYSVYLVHVPLLEVFWTLQKEQPWMAPGGRWTPLLVPNLLVVAVLLGWALWRGVEEPARRRLRRLTSARAAGGYPGPRSSRPEVLDPQETQR